MTIDLRIDNGTLVTSAHTFGASIGIHKGRIVLIGDPAHLPPATRTIDAGGLLVMAGLIDPHVHMRDPGHTEREDWFHGSRAAVAGGVTCVLEHPNSVPPVTNLQHFQYKKGVAEAQSCVDFGLYGGIGFFDDRESGERTPPQMADVEALVKAGVCAFKTFLWPYPDRKDEFDGITTLGANEMTVVFGMVAKTGKVLNVHAEDKPTVDAAMARLLSLPSRGPELHEPSRPIEAELIAVRHAIEIALAAGVRLNFPHCSGGTIVDAVGAARAQGHTQITAETCPQYLFLTAERLRVVGPYGKINPPIRSAEEQASLWRGLKAGLVETIGSDHAPHSKDAKEKAWGDIFAAPAGHPGLETTLPLMLTAAHEGKLTYNDVTRLCAENVARLYGLYPRKGILQVGADADIILIDPQRKGKFDSQTMQTKGRETAKLFEGMPYTGAPVMTLVRGRTMMDDGQITGQPGDGRFLAVGAK
ncbi:MAG: amidohydrolase family protein [Chloroflexi bacterium]|nr:amidohydrolase family protein [Chloroflexota bacterium]